MAGEAVLFNHSKVSSKSDTADPTLIQPSDWNDTHAVGGATTGAVMARNTGAADGASWTGVGAVDEALMGNGAGALPTFKKINPASTNFVLASEFFG